MSKLGHQLNSAEIVLRRPLVTERSSARALDENHPVYTFEVAANATKSMIATAIKQLYQVKPVKINIINHQLKKSKRALVYLSKGAKINFV